MIIKGLTLDQSSMINEVISLRRISWDENPKWEKRFDFITESLNSEIIELRPIHRAIICGCIREFIVDPNEDLFKLTDSEIINSINKIKPRIIRVDTGLSILNKLDRHLKIKYDYFSDRLNNKDVISNV